MHSGNANPTGLKNRLAAALSFLDGSEVLCDIGADHGRLVLAFAKTYQKPCYASEIAEGPFDRLCEAVEASPYGKFVTAYQADGLDRLPEGVNAVAILGMGGQTIAEILRPGQRELAQLQKAVVEPQGNAFDTRNALFDAGFVIDDEVYCTESGKSYPIILAKKGVETDPYDDVELEFGRIPLAKKDPILHRYLLRQVSLLSPFVNVPHPDRKSMIRLDQAKRALEKY